MHCIKVLFTQKIGNLKKHQHTKINSNGCILTPDVISEKTKNVEYPIKGRIHLRAAELRAELKAGVKKNDFDVVLNLNYGDCHAFGQKPLTFVRQVLTLCLMPDLLNSDTAYPDDVKKLVQHILGGCNGGAIGAYTDVVGLEPVRKDIAKYIGERDGFPCDYKTICTVAGAIDGIRSILEFLQPPANEKPLGVMIPVPTYSAYATLISMQHSHAIHYYLDEENGWSFDIEDLNRAYNESLDKCTPRVLCVINPGNPTGTVLTLENIQNIIKFAYEKNLLILADEVYQENIYNENIKFHSFRKVAHQMGAPYSAMEIVSLHSASKGFIGECGLRAGYAELCNFTTEMQKMFYKYVYIHSCSPVIGQACLSALCNLPKENDPSYALFKKESDVIFKHLKDNCTLVTKLFNSIEGISCVPVEGALYAFPRINLPKRAIEHAKSINMEPDDFYCLELVEQTGLCVVPGSAFGQRKGTYHFRTTAIAPTEVMHQVAVKFEKFHKRFMETWK